MKARTVFSEQTYITFWPRFSSNNINFTFERIAQRKAKAVIPPRSNAKIQQHPNSKVLPYPRDETIGRVSEVRSKQWKQESAYHRRSLTVCIAFRRKTAMFRLKTIFGGKLRLRFFENQAVELFLQCAALNRMIHLSKPDSYKVED